MPTGECSRTTPRFGRSGFVPASTKDYGLAAATSQQFFSCAREVANQVSEANKHKLWKLGWRLKTRSLQNCRRASRKVVDLEVLFEKTR